VPANRGGRTAAERDAAISTVRSVGLAPTIQHQNSPEPGWPRAGRAQRIEAFSLVETPDMSDFSISDQGSIFLIRPLNEAARQWLDENVAAEPWQWVQGALCVEARFARDLIIEIEEAGFEISP